MYCKTVTVSNPTGLHARPAASLATKAASFEAKVEVRNVTKEGDFRDARSMIAIMTAQVACGNDVELRAEGADERAAVDALVAFIEEGCGE